MTSLLLALALASAVAPIHSGNALTTPAARHLVRLEPPGGRPQVLLLALQQDGVQGRGLGFQRSDDGGRSWSHYKPIQDDWTERDTADLVRLGEDVALVYSYEGPRLSPSPRHDVHFQLWRFDGKADWSPLPAVQIFRPQRSTEAYSRAELAVDSRGRIWVQAFRLEADGSSTAVVAVSADGGRTFAPQPALATVDGRGGGRLISLGRKLLFLYGSHDPAVPGRMRLRADDEPLSSWSDPQVVFPDGLYHGAALSAVADGQGGLHLVYKSHAERLYYRRFDGARWSAAAMLEGRPDWALQPAVTLSGGDLVVFYNHPESPGYRFVARVLRNGTIGAPREVAPGDGFEGYPAALERSAGGPAPCVFGRTPGQDQGGVAWIAFFDPAEAGP